MMRHSVMMALAVGMLAFQGAPRADDTMPGMDMGGTASPADKAFAAAMDKMMKAMGSKPSGNTDKDFVVMMMPHHQGAIDMAKVELQYGKDPMLLRLAKGIVKAQETEIAEMKVWLAKHGR